MSRPDISIAMATYNGARFLEEQLQSFARQTLLPDEVVITDDGSTDDTLEIARQFASGAPFALRIHRNPKRLGFNRNFEAAVSRCEGDIIFFSDQDDVWFDRKLETVMSAFAANEKTQVVINGQIIADADLNHSDITMLDNLRSLGVSSDYLCSGCATAFRRDWGQAILPMPKEMDDRYGTGLDRWVNELAVLLGVRTLIEEPLQFFRRHGANTTESVMHRHQKVGLKNLIDDRMKRPPREAWLERIRVLSLYKSWLSQNVPTVEALNPVALNRALDAIDHEMLSMRNRAALASLPRPRRIGKIWDLWRHGGYRYFYGWKSIVRDFVR
jgi:glycosyltransferase involved in cell wall biosynthesis